MLESKFWLQRLPSVDEARPARCPACGEASRPVGGALVLVGHGVRERQIRGPTDVESEARVVVVAVRRYRCRCCEGVTMVVPRDVEPRRHFSRPAIALALALYGLFGQTAAEVRRRISPWQTVATAGWRTLSRWIFAVRRGGLIGVGASAGSATQVAAPAAQVVAGHAPPSERAASVLGLVFAGASAMA